MDLTSFFKQTAVYWAAPSSNGWGGNTFATPVQVSVRWMEKNDLFVDSSGKESVSKAVVLSETDFVLGGRLYLGTLASLSTEQKASPHTIDACYEIRGYNKTPSLDATEFLRRAFL